MSSNEKYTEKEEERAKQILAEYHNFREAVTSAGPIVEFLCLRIAKLEKSIADTRQAAKMGME